MIWVGLYLLIGLALSLIVILYIGIRYKSFLNFAIEKQLSEDTLFLLREIPTTMVIVVTLVIILLWPYIAYNSLREG
jgi:uncharacterized membrane protein